MWPSLTAFGDYTQRNKLVFEVTTNTIFAQLVCECFATLYDKLFVEIFSTKQQNLTKAE